MANKLQKGLTRRTFLKSSGAGLAAVGATSAGLLSVPKAAAQDGATGPGWETPPDPIPDSSIVETIDAEVVVVGAGFAGCTAACSAAEAGAQVVVIEKGPTWVGRGGGIGVVNSRMMRDAGIELDKEEIAREWIEMCGNRAKESLVWLFMNESGPAMDWWLDKADAAGIQGFLWGGNYKGPNYTEYPAYHMFFGPMAQAGRDPGSELANLMYEESVKLGVTYYFMSPGEQLVKDGDRVVGVIANTQDGYKRFNGSKGVILATGDIGGNPEMCAAYAPLALRANESDYTPIGVNTGDGHKMGLWAGGALQDTPFPTMIHPQAFSWFSPGCYPYINVRGERYMNEDSWVQGKSLGCMQQPDAPWAYSVLDSNWPENLEKSVEAGGGMFWDSFRPYGSEFSADSFRDQVASYIEQGDWGWSADTLEELAEKINVPVETFVASINRYNELVEGGKDLDYGKRPELLFPVTEAPFIALKFGPALLTVVGGLDVDTKLRVLDADQNPVPGLYAVGNVSGSAYGVDYPIQIPGNSHGRALTWGYLAGKNIVEAV
jgi:succinate dehydrogenase/fumarate reductase flavoprotein subunit